MSRLRYAGTLVVQRNLTLDFFSSSFISRFDEDWILNFVQSLFQQKINSEVVLGVVSIICLVKFVINYFKQSKFNKMRNDANKFKFRKSNKYMLALVNDVTICIGDTCIQSKQKLRIEKCRRTTQRDRF